MCSFPVYSWPPPHTMCEMHFCFLLLESASPHCLARLALLQLGQGAGSRAGGHRAGTAMAVFALQLSTCPVLPFSKKTEKSLQTRSTEMPRGRPQRKHGAISIDPCSFPPPPRRKVACCTPGMRLGSMSPLVNLPFSSPVCTEPFTVYLLPLLAAIVFPHVHLSGQRMFSSRAGGLRSLLVVVGLTFPVVTSLCLSQS